MIFQEFIKLVEGAFNKRKALFEKKVHDYATQDCLSNFYRMSKICDVLQPNVRTPIGTCMFYILIKLDRLNNLLHKDGKPQNESLDDTLNDMQNYIDLLRALLKENEE